MRIFSVKELSDKHRKFKLGVSFKTNKKHLSRRTQLPMVLRHECTVFYTKVNQMRRNLRKGYSLL